MFLSFAGSMQAQELPSSTSQDTVKSIDSEAFQKIEEKIIALRSKYMSLMEKKLSYSVEAELVKPFSREAYVKFYDRAEKKANEAKPILEKMNQLIKERNQLSTSQIKIIDSKIRSMVDDEENLSLQVKEYHRQANQLADSETEEYQRLMEQASEKGNELDILRAHLKILRLQRKLLLMQQGDPDNEEDSPYQT
jgi:hypothetical protein